VQEVFAERVNQLAQPVEAPADHFHGILSRDGGRDLAQHVALQNVIALLPLVLRTFKLVVLLEVFEHQRLYLHVGGSCLFDQEVAFGQPDGQLRPADCGLHADVLVELRRTVFKQVLLLIDLLVKLDGEELCEGAQQVDGATLLVESVGADVHALVLLVFVLVLHEILLLTFFLLVENEDVVQPGRLGDDGLDFVDDGELVIDHLHQAGQLLEHGFLDFTRDFGLVVLNQTHDALVDVAEVAEQLFLQGLVHGLDQVGQTDDGAAEQQKLVLRSGRVHDDALGQQLEFLLVIDGLFACDVQNGRHGLEGLLPALD